MSVGSDVSSTAPRQQHTYPSVLGSAAEDADTEPLEEPEEKHSPEPLPAWASEAFCRLTQSERELYRVRERQAREIEEVNQGLERTILGVQTEERLLLERVQQDHRDAQRHLEQLQRENAAAARVSQSLVDQRLYHIAQLKKDLKEWAGVHCASHQNRLLKGVSELLQPWEITLSLRRVSFRPSSQPKPISFGDIQIYLHNVSIPVGACGTPGQQCTLHSDTAQEEEDTIRAANAVGRGVSQTEASELYSRHECILREIGPLLGTEGEPKEEVTMPSPRSRQWPPLQASFSKESCKEEDLHLLNSDPGDFYQPLPVSFRSRTSDVNEAGDATSEDSQRVQENLVMVSDHKGITSLKEDRLEHDSCRAVDQEVTREDMLKCTCSALPPQHNQDQELVSSENCLCLSSKDYLCSCLNLCPNKRSLKSHSEVRRSSSPTDSLDSCYTFIVSSPRDYCYSLSSDRRMSKSTVDLSGRNRPMIDGGKEVPQWNLRTKQSVPRSTRKRSVASRTLSTPRHKNGNCQSPSQGQGPVGRSLSMSVIELPFSNVSRKEQLGEGDKQFRENAESTSTGDEEVLSPLDVGRLVRQFGKQGSGRSDFTLPSGLHATPQGQLFVVDCGNARVQVTDPRGNIIQQMSSGGVDSSSRRCRNYFDIAVSAKGLIALSCAAQRALLIFSRHGRQLQKFGGAAMGGPVELDAPRGVAINYLDEFLVADVRRGTLTALKLDSKTGSKLECTTVSSFYRPYLVAACSTTRLVAVSERGNEAGQAPCIKVLGPDYSVIRILGKCLSVGPLLSRPWGICIDSDGDVLVADWGKDHHVVIYPAQGAGRPIVTQGLSGPRGLTLLPQGQLVVSDSMHHCIKIFKYK